ncbi:MAG: hydrogenase expression/formation protein HypE [Candidatus Heimdallarchaeota archaeon]|nr:hydrogenase expression/formation protein HypE [Candidatus Heimdallarchaeota archaeon]
MKDKTVDLSMGGGGKRMDLLIDLIGKHIGITDGEGDIVGPQSMDDAAVVTIPDGTFQLVITTDSHTVDPIFFQGGNIGDLLIAGTVNDLTVMGAIPKYLTIGMIIEEGYLIEDLVRICETIGNKARAAGVRIIAGDTKVMPKGMVSNIVINSAGVGYLYRDPIRDSAAQIGDKIIITGEVGNHGTSLMALREGMEFTTTLQSDVTALWPAVKEITANTSVHCMKDPTRGGLATALNEIAEKSNVCLEIDELSLPINEQAQAIADILGLEMMEISSEGRAVMVVAADAADEIIEKLHNQEITQGSVIIGEVKESPKTKVLVKTDIGGTRILEKPYGEPIPRVC